MDNGKKKNGWEMQLWTSSQKLANHPVLSEYWLVHKTEIIYLLTIVNFISSWPLEESYYTMYMGFIMNVALWALKIIYDPEISSVLA